MTGQNIRVPLYGNSDVFDCERKKFLRLWTFSAKDGFIRLRSPYKRFLVLKFMCSIYGKGKEPINRHKLGSIFIGRSDKALALIRREDDFDTTYAIHREGDSWYIIPEGAGEETRSFLVALSKAVEEDASWTALPSGIFNRKYISPKATKGSVSWPRNLILAREGAESPLDFRYAFQVGKPIAHHPVYDSPIYEPVPGWKNGLLVRIAGQLRRVSTLIGDVFKHSTKKRIYAVPLRMGDRPIKIPAWILQGGRVRYAPVKIWGAPWLKKEDAAFYLDSLLLEAWPEYMVNLPDLQKPRISGKKWAWEVPSSYTFSGLILQRKCEDYYVFRNQRVIYYGRSIREALFAAGFSPENGQMEDNKWVFPNGCEVDLEAERVYA